ncbi:hypothetical protein RUM43_006699 [Polyplax serrata]|uniref:Death domain-containing protein n=1 Tax=Polyplax serrata TaxID=468196 RepID=A0AAN8NTR8_POLSC
MLRFEEIHTSFKAQVMSTFSTNKTEKLEKLYNSSPLGDMEKRVILDHILRDCILQLAIEIKNELHTLEQFVSFAIELSRKDICSTSTPVVLLSDIFDIFTLDQCEELFVFVENEVSIWKEDLFFGACKNNLLRMCNDLLRRLSRSQNTVFRGRILLFLAKFFPFSERSGLNIVSEFNLDNIAEFSQDSQIDNFDSPEENKDDTKFKIDYNFYNKFLTLQEFMRSPNQCYNKIRWRVFVNSANDVLAAFKNFKLDAEQFQDKPIVEHFAEATSSTFFAKYMTNPKLLELQLSDSDFRRSILIQFLIILQYLSSPVKFKLESYELELKQLGWIKEQVELVYQLLAETPTNSEKFAQAVKHILSREELWNNWKNEGCPEFKKPGNIEEKDLTKLKVRGKKRTIGDRIKDAAHQKKYYMGHSELTRLWNLNPNNLEACKAKERKFLPDLDEYFEEAIIQMDPAAEIEPEYKKVRDSNFGWRALRLLTQKSSCFFISANNPVTGLADYLELSLKKIIQERPQNANEEIRQEVLNTEAEEVEELLKPEDKEVQEDATEEVVFEPKIAAELLEAIAAHVGDQWRKLALKLGHGEKEIEIVAKEKSTDTERAEKVLKMWTEVDVDASPENLAYTLEGIHLISAVELLKSKTGATD